VESYGLFRKGSIVDIGPDDELLGVVKGSVVPGSRRWKELIYLHKKHLRSGDQMYNLPADPRNRAYWDDPQLPFYEVEFAPGKSILLSESEMQLPRIDWGPGESITLATKLINMGLPSEKARYLPKGKEDFKE
jgi:hypothetical protein